MVDQRDQCNASQSSDQPADTAPEQKNVDAEIGINVGQKARFELAAHGHQQGGEGHGNQRKND